MLLYQLLPVKDTINTRFARFSTVDTPQKNYCCNMLYANVRHQFLQTTFIPTPISDKLFCSAQNCTCRTVRLNLNSNRCNITANWRSFMLYCVLITDFFHSVLSNSYANSTQLTRQRYEKSHLTYNFLQMLCMQYGKVCSSLCFMVLSDTYCTEVWR